MEEFNLFSRSFYFFSVGASDSKLAVLKKMSEQPRLYTSKGRLGSELQRRYALWDELCVYAHQVGATTGLMLRDDFRRKFYKKWRGEFLVGVIFIFIFSLFRFRIRLFHC